MSGSIASRDVEGRALAAPPHVAIIGLGPSVRAYLSLVNSLGGRSAYCDEVWGINALGDTLACDRIFHMDDVRVQEVRAAARPKSNIANMLAWMRHARMPIYTSRTHPEYPALVEYPLESVINSTGQAYFNSTAAYAIAYAVHIGVRKISVHGMDFTYPDAHDAEKGRACVEFWLGIAHARGIQISLTRHTTLLDGYLPFDQRLYGYDTLKIGVQRVPTLNDSAAPVYRLEFEERPLPTAEEIESRYDHSRHPNALVEVGNDGT